MTLKETVFADMKTAMREKDSIKLETIRMLRAAIQRKEVDDRVELDDQAVLQVVQKMVKQCTDAATQFSAGGRHDLVARENANIAVLEYYLPAKLSDQEVDDLVGQAVEQAGATSMKDMGKVVGLLKLSLQGRADMGVVSAKVKSLLS